MTDQHARTAANVVMATAALGAAFFVLRTPRLRRLVWLLARQYIVAGLVAPGPG